jgi:hypothetical protein
VRLPFNYFVKSTEGKMLSMAEHPPPGHKCQLSMMSMTKLFIFDFQQQNQNPTEEDTENADGNTTEVFISKSSILVTFFQKFVIVVIDIIRDFTRIILEWVPSAIAEKLPGHNHDHALPLLKSPTLNGKLVVKTNNQNFKRRNLKKK